MKKYLIIVIILISINSKAQNYLINFTGSGESTIPTTVFVENLTTGTSITLNGTDILRLSTLTVNPHEIQKKSIIKIFPNPVSDNTIIEINPPTEGNLTISLLDLSGRFVAWKSFNMENSLQQYRISGLKKGVYIIILRGKSFQYSEKLVSIVDKPENIRIEKLMVTQISKNSKSDVDSKGGGNIVDMAYSPGDILKFTASSGIFETITTAIPTQDQTIDFNFLACSDANNYNYSIVEIGNQIWMAEDLRATKFNDGTLLPNITDDAEWQSLITPAYCWTLNDVSTSFGKGALYNWYVTSYPDKNVCPLDWHVPTNDEWRILENYLGKDVAGGKLKEIGTDFWNSPNTGADNSTGFTAYPDGSRSNEGIFYDLGLRNYYWTSTLNTSQGIGRRLVSYSSNIETYYAPKNSGFHIRCLKGLATIPVVTTSQVTDIFYTSAIGGGNVTSDGGNPITEVGICFGPSPDPTTSNTKIIKRYHTIGAFTIPITNLLQNTRYYVRAYATNSVGTAYGEQVNFMTPPSNGLVVTTEQISYSSRTTATGGGNIVSDGILQITERGICFSTNTNPSISDTKIIASGTAGSFVSDFVGLTPNSTYHVRAYATNTQGTTYGRDVFFSTKGESGTVSDIEGNIYSTIIIGTQKWMTENLKTTKYSDGSAIPNITDNSSWAALTSDAFCWYNNDISNKNVYGALYNHFAVTDSRHICPTGWHVPFQEEFNTLIAYIQGSDWLPFTSSNKFRETGTGHWESPNSGATNTSGFNALPGGSRFEDGVFWGDKIFGYFWGATSLGINPYDLAYNLIVSSDRIEIGNGINFYGHAIRCISDNTPIPSITTKNATSISSSGAKLNGEVNAENQNCNLIFEYGLTNSYGSSIIAIPNVVTGSSTTEVSALITGLTQGTTYHFRLKLVYSGGTVFGDDISFSLPAKVSDIDGNSYNVATIGNRVWMAEDLRTFKYSDGSPVIGVYQYDDFFNQDVHVQSNTWLYTWSAAMNGAESSNNIPSNIQGVCPTGWHLPSHSEWTQLINDLGGESVAGGKLKEAGFLHWTSPNAGATNESGFTALPGGYRSLGGYFFREGEEGNYWTSTEYNSANAMNITLYSLYPNALMPYNSKLLGYSVRCLKNLTEPYAYPVVSTKYISNITNTSAISGGTINGNQGTVISARGICYNTSHLPTINDHKTTDALEGPTYSSTLSGLELNTTYYVRAYATNSIGTGYGEEFHFTTGQNVTTPTLSTLALSNITSTGCWSGGIVLSDGGSTIISRGVCWSIVENPTIFDNLTNDGIGTGSFLSSITGLTPGVTYYLKAYATNSAGVSYGGQVSFQAIGAPTLTTIPASSITQTSALSGGNVTNDGGATVTARGICWSISPNPTLLNNVIPLGSGNGTFTCSISGLIGSTQYYVRAYATNIAGTNYGNEISFMTTTLPTVTTNAITSITQTTAIGGGNITNNGGATITARGICWNTSEFPTIANSKTNNGTGNGSFTSSLTGLTAGTIYYIRAFATNVNGTSYGNQQIIITSDATLPTLSISNASSITSTSAFIQGVVNTNGGADVTECGIYYSTSSNPQSTGTKVILGSGTIAFSTSLTSLSSNVKYYVIAYAKNSIGTAYSSEINFTTLTLSPPSISLISKAITDITCNGSMCYGKVTITVQVSNYEGISDIFCTPDLPLTSQGNGIYTFSSSNAAFIKDVIPPYEYTIYIDVNGLVFDSLDIDIY